MTWPDDFIDKVIEENCLEVMRQMPDACVDAIVTDPPYGLEFMGKEWDKLTRNLMNPTSEADKQRKVEYGDSYVGRRSNLPDYSNRDKVAMQGWHHDWAVEALRVLKPGGYLLAFGGTRTYHRLACAIEDAGFEIRDQIAWLYGSGFPKSLDVSKAIDKAAGAEREVLGSVRAGFGKRNGKTDAEGGIMLNSLPEHLKHIPTTAPATAVAKEWEGFGTALKPAHEPICLARKPLSEKTVAENVLKWGVGALDIDGCRVATDVLVDDMLRHVDRKERQSRTWRDGSGFKNEHNELTGVPMGGRWPANLIHDGSDEVVEMFPQSKSTGGSGEASRNWKGDGHTVEGSCQATGGFGDSGSAARFFYAAKASRSERGNGNGHPTVKPIALMEYLIRLVSRPGYIICDPFLGSGTTAIACIQTGRHFVGIELDPGYCEIARRRIAQARTQLALV